MSKPTTHPHLRKFHCAGGEFVRYSRRPRHIDPEFAYLVRVCREHSATVVARDEAGAARAFRELTGGVRPETVGGRAVDGQCEGCDAPIFDGDERYTDVESVMLCGECGRGIEMEGGAA